MKVKAERMLEEALPEMRPATLRGANWNAEREEVRLWKIKEMELQLKAREVDAFEQMAERLVDIWQMLRNRLP